MPNCRFFETTSWREQTQQPVGQDIKPKTRSQSDKRFRNGPKDPTRTKNGGMKHNVASSSTTKSIIKQRTTVSFITVSGGHKRIRPTVHTSVTSYS